MYMVILEDDRMISYLDALLQHATIQGAQAQYHLRVHDAVLNRARRVTPEEMEAIMALLRSREQQEDDGESTEES